MAVLEITADNFDTEVLQASKPVLLDFWASWCGPCRKMSPVVEELADELGDSIVVGKVNVDDERELATRHGVSSIPTLMVFQNGTVAATKVGVCPKEEIMELLH